MTYPTVSFFLENVFNIRIPLPFPTFGFFLAIAFFLGAYVIKKEFLRLEKLQVFKKIPLSNQHNKLEILSDYLISGMMSFWFGFKILYLIKNYRLFTEDPTGTLFSSEGNIIVGLITLFFTITSIYRSNKQKTSPKINMVLPSDLYFTMIAIAAISGIFGAKLFSLFEDLNYLISDPLNAIFSGQGLTFYGGLICGTISIILYAKKHNIKIPYLADVFAPSLILSYGIGRLGCHFSGDGDWGIVSNLDHKPSFLPDWFWGYKYPHNVIEFKKDFDPLPAQSHEIPYGTPIDDCVGKYCSELSHTVYPTAIYEALFCIIAFVFLWNIRKNIQTPGILFCIYLIINGIERFFIEFIRVTEKYQIVGLELTQAQIIGILICIIGIFGIYYLHQQKSIKNHEAVKE